MENIKENIDIIIKTVVEKVVDSANLFLPVGVSNRHIHLSKKDLEILFGKNYNLKKLRDLKQPGQFAAQETVTIVGPTGSLHNVRILGPTRNLTQVEISRSDSFALGIKTPLRISGNIENTPGITIIGPNATLTIGEGVIIAANHLHLSETEAKELNLVNGQRIVLRAIQKERKVYFADVVVRCGKGHLKEFHIDTDEANSCMLNSGDLIELVY